MINVKKRDGKIVEFDIQKIKDAIEKAFMALDKKYTPGSINAIGIINYGESKLLPITFTSDVENWGLFFKTSSIFSVVSNF